MGSATAPGGGSTDRDRREEQADARDEAADRRERRDDARERVLDRWEQELTERAVSLRALDDADEDRRAHARAQRAADHARRRADAETRRDAAIERDIDRSARAQAGEHDDDLAVLTTALARLADAVDDDRPMSEILDLLLTLVSDCVPGAAAATVCLTVDGRLVHAAATAAWAADLDATQLGAGDGPIRRAVDTGELVAHDDPVTHRAVISAPLVTDRTSPGALTVYGHQHAALRPSARLMLTALSTAASLAAGRTLDRLSHDAQTQAWERALQSRDEIGQAKGVLMEMRKLTSEQAFDLLRSTSQRLNVKVRDVAEQVVRHRHLPGPDAPPTRRS